MVGKLALLALASISPAFAAGDDAPLKRGGMALAVEAGFGGDGLETVSDTKLRAGDGISAMVGGFYRPRADLPLEFYGLVGYDAGLIVPVQGGGGYNTTLTSPVVEVLANYRFDNKWFVAGGLVSRLNPKFSTDNPDYNDINFDTATGVTVEAGWSFIGLYYTYMEYKSSQVNLDASSVGVRFTLRFRKWRPVH
jgi:hypothetical protein